jgi:LAO/AO transport system kinase
MSDLVTRVLAGERRALARALTLAENGGPEGQALLAAIYPHTGRAHVVGVTGPPGGGKSSLVNALARIFRQQGKTVAIVAVDPTSPYTGGAVMGDRIRMRDHAGDPGVFIRSMASRGSLGGLATATGDVVTLFDGAGFDLVLVETVGAGQVEVDIAREAHTTIVIEAPGLGDEIQAIKAGLLEIADIFVVNKADREGAQHAARALQMNLELGHKGTSTWMPPVLQTIATTGQGVNELADAILQHRTMLEQTGEWQARIKARLNDELRHILQRELFNHFMARLGPTTYAAVLDQVVARAVDPYTAASKLLTAEP